MSPTGSQSSHDAVRTAAIAALQRLGYDTSSLADPTLRTVETTFARVLAYHEEQFRAADKASDEPSVIESLAGGEFAYGRRPGVNLWEDVTLAALLLLHDELAARLFCDRYAQQVSGWEHRYSRGASFSVEEFLADLLLPRGDAGPRISRYAGRGPLDGWLRQVYVSICHKRREQQAGPAGKQLLATQSNSADLGYAASVESDEDPPDERYARHECAELLAPLISKCMGVLDDAHRQVLLMSVVDGVQQKKIAKLYGVADYKITRMKQAAIKRVRDAFVEAARRSLKMAGDSLHLCIELLLERFPVI